MKAPSRGEHGSFEELTEVLRKYDGRRSQGKGVALSYEARG